ncbi:PREDICTED: uncharacterized protein LOC109327775 [Lupinus angustifolius]|uniref:uncharacterized protein LOC109327775 n=1 Tax=Lupinus angustifolius TaxID=3871 RepID=UPI00092EF5E3|nr:PREDICTED: uncharacterized protein LOC109327775 [Lupinus angustifolius]
MAFVTDPGSRGEDSPPPPPAATFPPVVPLPLQASSPSLNLLLPSTKLTDKNFLVWRQFILAVLRSNRAERFISDMDPPPQFLSDRDRIHHRLNPAFLSWDEQDQLLLSWILNSLSEELQPRVVGCSTSQQLWLENIEHCQAQTKARGRQLRAQLRLITKGSNTISEYFTRIKVLDDSLISIGSPITQAEHVDFILDGLSEEFQPIITAVESQYDLPTVNELQSFLLTFESRLERNRNRSVSDALSVNVAAGSPLHSWETISSGLTFMMPMMSSHARSDMVRAPHHGPGGFRGGSRGYKGGSHGFRGSRCGGGRFSSKNNFY